MPVKKHKLGWQPDYPDFRDFSIDNFTDADLAKNQKQTSAGKHSEELRFSFKKNFTTHPLTEHSLREHCSPVEKQGDLSSCTAHAGAALIEYYEKRNFKTYEKCSRLFLYKVTRNYMRSKGDNGANPRNTMAAMVLFGVPPEKYWEYNEADFDVEPPAFLYAFAQNYKTAKFFKHDTGHDKAQILANIKQSLLNGIPSMCGFSLYSSYTMFDDCPCNKGCIPYPGKYDGRLGGHCVAVFGFNDKKVITHKTDNSITTTGAFLIKNSWGEEWGDRGYGWLPYKYLEDGLAIDWWSIIKKEWVNTDAFDDDIAIPDAMTE